MTNGPIWLIFFEFEVSALFPPGGCRSTRASWCDWSYRGPGKKPVRRVLWYYTESFLLFHKRQYIFMITGQFWHVQGFYLRSMLKTDFVIRMLFSLQGLMGRPGPIGPTGGKGEKVRCFTTSAIFSIMYVECMPAWVLYRVYSGWMGTLNDLNSMFAVFHADQSLYQINGFDWEFKQLLQFSH